MSRPRLFEVPTLAVDEPPDTPLEGATAEDIKAALRRRHPGETHGSMPGQWTCIEEWLGIDLLALNAWSKADVIGYEVKISRSDLRRELLKPHKRADALERTTEFYLAVPAGLLTAAEIAYEEPEWEASDFDRAECPGVPQFGPEVRAYLRERRYGGKCVRYPYEGSRRSYCVPAPVPEVTVVPDWMRGVDGEDETARAERWLQAVRYSEDKHVPCWICGGKGYLDKSRVERDAPTCWVPRDVGLVVVSARGCRVVRHSPRRNDPKPIAVGRKNLNDLVRWVSHRPDPRHR